MSRRSFELWLIWQNTETRQRYHVGTLTYMNGLYTFYYENNDNRRKLREALENGYQQHLAFPDVNKTYTSHKLFGPFARRTPDPRRPDYVEVLHELGLTENCTDMDVLLATGGLLATDDYEFVAPIQIDETEFYFEFYLAGWRHYVDESEINHLTEGDKIHFLLEPDNDKDSKAVIVESAKGKMLGYIPAFYSGWMFNEIFKGVQYNAVIEAVHPEADPHRKVRIFVKGLLSTSSERNSDLQENKEDSLIPVAY